MDELICDICNEKFKSIGGLNKHKITCSRINDLKETIIDEYKKIQNTDKLSKKYHISQRIISKNLKKWGLKLNNEDGIIGLSGQGRKIHLNENFFDIMDEKRYWFIGLMAADGNIKKRDPNYISISQSGDNGLKILTYVKQLLELDFEIKKKDFQTKQTVYTINFSSNKISMVLNAHNIIPNKTKTYKFPDIIPEKYIPAFLVGYFDGDGCITINKIKDRGYYYEKLTVCVVGTYDFILECQNHIPIKGVFKKGHGIYELTWVGEKAILVCDWLYSNIDVYHSYKYDNYIRWKERYINSKSYKNKKENEIINKELLSRFNNDEIKDLDDLVPLLNRDRNNLLRRLKGFYKKGLLNKDYKYLLKTMRANKNE